MTGTVIFAPLLPWEVIAGIGINVNQEQFPHELVNAVSVKQLTGNDTDRDIFTQDLLNSIQNKFNLIFDGRYDE